MNKTIAASLIVGTALLALIGVLIGSARLGGEQPQPPPQDAKVVSQSGIHWHPSLEIYVRGEKVAVPANIGVGPGYAGKPSYGNGGMAMTAIHTHEDIPIIHLEFSGLVTERNIRLGNFFRIWGKDMNELGTNRRMVVNGVLSSMGEDYVMRDGDKIELHYD